jgi:Peptidase family M23
VLAVADGTIFSVGWNHLGGYRVWLRDRQGNQFYYAHLSAYSPVAVNGRKVRAGTVLGFVGATGDAVGTPYHLHFEIHPVSLVHLGYDGAVDPTPYLDAWKHVQDVRFAPLGWAVPSRRPRPGVKPAPPPGAILLQATDISTASGLDPDSFDRVLAIDSVDR